LIDLNNDTSYVIREKDTKIYNHNEIIKCKLIINNIIGLIPIESPEIYIQVLHHVKIKFSTDKTHIVQTFPTTLRWQIQNASKIFLDNETNIIQSYGELPVYPDETTTYTIYASNELDQQISKIRVAVFPIPKIRNINLPKLPSLTPNLKTTFAKPISWNKKQYCASIVPPQNLNKNILNKLYSFVNKKSHNSGKALADKVIFNNISTNKILNLIIQKTNHE